MTNPDNTGKNKSDIKDTALITACARAKEERVSQDTLAKYWATETAKNLLEEYLNEISHLEAPLIALRHRFCLERAKKFLSAHPGSLFVNLASGVSSYPYLLPGGHQYYEGDFKETIQRKTSKYEEIKTKTNLPERNITYFECNLNTQAGLDDLEEKLTEILKTTVSFVLLEGITYYLDIERLEQLFQILKKLQQPNSQIALVCWPTQTLENPQFHALQKFFQEKFGMNEKKYTFLNSDFFKKLQGYKIAEATSSYQVEKEFAPYLNLPKNPAEVFDEDLYILQRL